MKLLAKCLAFVLFHVLLLCSWALLLVITIVVLLLAIPECSLEIMRHTHLLLRRVRLWLNGWPWICTALAHCCTFKSTFVWRFADSMLPDDADKVRAETSRILRAMSSGTIPKANNSWNNPSFAIVNPQGTMESGTGPSWHDGTSGPTGG